MKKIARFVLLAALLGSTTWATSGFYTAKAEIIQENIFNQSEIEEVNAFQGLQIGGKACYLMDFASETVFASDTVCPSAFYKIFQGFSYGTSHLEKCQIFIYYEDTKKE